MMLKNEIEQILKKHGLRPNKLLGQNFLIDRGVLKKIIAAADLSKNDTILEVGPGLGILTEELAKHVGQVIAVEKDKEIAKIVRNVLADGNIENVEIIQGDALRLPTTDYRLPTDYKVVANIPYYLTSHLIRKFLESENPPREMILMVQKEVAQRICARPPRMSLLAVSVQFYAQPEIISYVSKKSFWPQPKVDSAIIKITPRFYSPLYKREVRGDLTPAEEILPNPPLRKEKKERFFCVIHAGFSHPRKQLINNLSRELKIDREKITQVLKKIGLAPEQRAETLTIKDWTKLAEQLSAVLR